MKRREKTGAIISGKAIVWTILMTVAFSYGDQVDDLLGQLNNPDLTIRCQAIEQLGELKDKRAIPPLIALLSTDAPAAADQTDADNVGGTLDTASQKVATARRACAGGNRHTPPIASTDPAILKQLIADIRKAPNFIEKEKAIHALGETRDKRALEPLMALLKEKDFGSIHQKTIEAIGKIGDPQAVPVLLKYLPAVTDNQAGTQSPKPMYGPTAREAARALAKIGDPRTAESLYRAVSSDPFLKNEAVELLVEFGGSEGIKYLNRLASSEDIFVREKAAKALEAFGEYHGLEPLVQLLGDADSKVRSLAATALADTGDASVTSALQKAAAGLDQQDRQTIEGRIAGNTMTSESDPSIMQATVKITAIEVLGQFKDPRVVRPLLAALHDENEAVCKAAGKALGGYPGKSIIRPIELALSSRDKEMVRQALRDLGFIGTDYAVELIASQMKDPFVSREAIEALGCSGNPKALPYLEQAMQSPLTEDTAMEALLQIHLPETVPLLLKGLASQNFVTRRKALEALGRFEDPSAIEPLIEHLKKNDSAVQDQLIETLKTYRDPRVDTAFVELLGDPVRKEKILAVLKERNWQPRTTREKVLYSAARQEWDECARLGPEGANVLLEELKKNPSDGVARALNQINEQRAFPLMLEYVKQWRGSLQMLIGAEKTGWIPKTAQEHLIVAYLRLDKEALKKLWNDPQGKQEYMKALDSENLSAVSAVIQISISMGLEEMVQPMIRRFNSISSDTAAVSIANLFLNSGQQGLRSAAESWASAHGYQIHQFGFSTGSQWRSW